LRVVGALHGIDLTPRSIEITRHRFRSTELTALHDL
jgi:hypothetical protein